MYAKNRIINVKGAEIRIIRKDGHDYVSLTDMLKSKDGDFFISDWLRNRNTVEFLGIWESVNNHDFNYGEFAIIKNSAGLNSFKISVKEWVEKTQSVGLISSAGRYGGTFAHVDIAFEFGMWISPEFKVYLIKEFHRLKEEEQKRLHSPWNLHRTLAKINYRIHTDAIREHLIPADLSRSKMNKIYSSEADILNVALFGMTAGEWKQKNPDVQCNMRDEATIEQLIVLSNLESLNAVFIENGVLPLERLYRLNQAAITQMKSLINNTHVQRLHDEQLRVEEPRAAYGVAS